MTWLDRGGTHDDRGGETFLRVLAVLLLVVLIGLSGLLGPVAGSDVSFPVIGTGDAVTGEAGGAGDPASVVGADGTDSDGDGLVDAVEDEFGTDPTRADTDGDGYPDGMEVGCGDRLPEADPLRQDVYVEVDSVSGAALSDATVDRIEETFADAPVSNPSGADGIAIHLVRSDDALAEDGPVNNRETPGNRSDIPDYRELAFDNADVGYHYLLVVSDAAYNGDPSYAGAGYRGNAVVEHYDRDGVMASLVMHELGHAFGLMHNQEGVDEDTYELAEYESVMNYNGIYETTTYSDGTDEVGRDEWDFVANDRHSPELDCPDGDCLALCSSAA